MSAPAPNANANANEAANANAPANAAADLQEHITREHQHRMMQLYFKTMHAAASTAAVATPSSAAGSSSGSASSSSAATKKRGSAKLESLDTGAAASDPLAVALASPESTASGGGAASMDDNSPANAAGGGGAGASKPKRKKSKTAAATAGTSGSSGARSPTLSGGDSASTISPVAGAVGGGDASDAAAKPDLNRIAMACTPCHKSKLRCDGVPGQACSRCIKRGRTHECVRPEHNKPGPTPREGSVPRKRNKKPTAASIAAAAAHAAAAAVAAAAAAAAAANTSTGAVGGSRASAPAAAAAIAAAAVAKAKAAAAAVSNSAKAGRTSPEAAARRAAAAAASTANVPQQPRQQSTATAAAAAADCKVPTLPPLSSHFIYQQLSMSNFGAHHNGGGNGAAANGAGGAAQYHLPPNFQFYPLPPPQVIGSPFDLLSNTIEPLPLPPVPNNQTSSGSGGGGAGSMPPPPHNPSHVHSHPHHPPHLTAAAFSAMVKGEYPHPGSALTNLLHAHGLPSNTGPYPSNGGGLVNAHHMSVSAAVASSTSHGYGLMDSSLALYSGGGGAAVPMPGLSGSSSSSAGSSLSANSPSLAAPFSPALPVVANGPLTPASPSTFLSISPAQPKRRIAEKPHTVASSTPKRSPALGPATPAGMSIDDGASTASNGTGAGGGGGAELALPISPALSLEQILSLPDATPLSPFDFGQHAVTTNNGATPSSTPKAAAAAGPTKPATPLLTLSRDAIAITAAAALAATSTPASMPPTHGVTVTAVVVPSAGAVAAVAASSAADNYTANQQRRDMINRKLSTAIQSPIGHAGVSGTAVTVSWKPTAGAGGDAATAPTAAPTTTTATTAVPAAAAVAGGDSGAVAMTTSPMYAAPTAGGALVVASAAASAAPSTSLTIAPHIPDHYVEHEIAMVPPSCAESLNMVSWVSPQLLVCFISTMHSSMAKLLSEKTRAVLLEKRAKMHTPEVQARLRNAPQFAGNWVAELPNTATALTATSNSASANSAGGAASGSFDASWFTLPMAVIRHEHRDPRLLLHFAAADAFVAKQPPPPVRVAVNSAATELLGYTTQEYIGLYSSTPAHFKLLHPAFWRCQFEFEIRAIGLFRQWANQAAAAAAAAASSPSVSAAPVSPNFALPVSSMVLPADPSSQWQLPHPPPCMARGRKQPCSVCVGYPAVHPPQLSFFGGNVGSGVPPPHSGGGATPSSTASVATPSPSAMNADGACAGVIAVAALSHSSGSGSGSGPGSSVSSSSASSTPGSTASTTPGGRCFADLWTPAAIAAHRTQTILEADSTENAQFCDTNGKQVYTTIAQRRVAVRFSRPGCAEKTSLVHVINRDGRTIPTLLTSKISMSYDSAQAAYCTRIEMVYVPILEGLL